MCLFERYVLPQLEKELTQMPVSLQHAILTIISTIANDIVEWSVDALDEMENNHVLPKVSCNDVYVGE